MEEKKQNPRRQDVCFEVNRNLGRAVNTESFPKQLKLYYDVFWNYMFKRMKDNGAADDEERQHKIREGEWNYFS